MRYPINPCNSITQKVINPIMLCVSLYHDLLLNLIPCSIKKIRGPSKVSIITETPKIK
jgi:hypothetical protein